MKNKWTRFLLIGIAIASLTLSACGGGGSSGGETTDDGGTNPVAMTGQFIDSAVSGLIYSCSSGNSGFTNAEGEFACYEGDTVEFFVGDYSIGSATAKKYITPYDLYPTDSNAAIDVARLLLTLDSDGDPTNGITIPELLPSNLGSVTARPGEAAFNEAINSALDEELISTADAEEHLQGSYDDLLSTWDYHFDIGVPFYNVFFENNEWKIITIELTSDTAVKATFEDTPYNGTWVVIDDLEYGEILNVSVAGQDPGYYRLDGVEENRLSVCYADALNEMVACDVEYFYFNLADAQAHGGDDTGGGEDTDLGALTFQGTTSSLSYLYFDDYGCEGSVCNIDISITSFQLDSDGMQTESGRGVYLEMFFPTSSVSPGTYTWSTSLNAGTFSDWSGIGIVDESLNVTENNATGGSVTITRDGTDYVINGSVTTAAGTATFSYSGPLAAEF